MVADSAGQHVRLSVPLSVRLSAADGHRPSGESRNLRPSTFECQLLYERCMYKITFLIYLFKKYIYIFLLFVKTVLYIGIHQAIIK